ncbi:ferredoxin [Kitasatospora sp. NPDC059577]|uniref:ferredoxin n=1 Tax=unclassified Kitasatospora TaxID=2633591 RepID=UPI0036B474A7
MIRVEVDPVRCVGVGQCAAIAPEVFELLDEGRSAPVTGWVDEADAEAALAEDARELCPAQAISLHRTSPPG